MHCTSHLVAASCAALLLLAAAAAAQSAATAQSGLQPGGKLIELDEDNWHLMLQGEWMIEL